jgi:hypothetical protein
MVGLAQVLDKQGNTAGAQAAYQRAIEFGNADWAANALVFLGVMLRKRGDRGGARAAFQQVVDSGNADWAPSGLVELLNLLRDQDDLDGARAAHRMAVETGNPDASYALVVIGDLLAQRGDVNGAKEAWQQAIDTGYGGADHLREFLSPPAEDDDADDGGDDAEPVDLPPEFDPRNMAQTGIAVLDHGLPPLPDVLSYQMAIPVAYWIASQCAVVLFLKFSRHRQRWQTTAIMVTFRRDQGHWTADPHWLGTSWGHDPIAHPGDLRNLDGGAMVVSGESRTDTPAAGELATIWHGRAAPAVRQIALIQDGREDRRPLTSHFGAWVVCSEQPSPFHVTAFDQNGTVLTDIG